VILAILAPIGLEGGLAGGTYISGGFWAYSETGNIFNYSTITLIKKVFERIRIHRKTVGDSFSL